MKNQLTMKIYYTALLCISILSNAQESKIIDSLYLLRDSNFKEFERVWQTMVPQIKSQKNKIKIYNAASNAYKDLGNIEMMIKTNDIAVKLALEIDDNESVANSYINRSMGFIALGVLNKAEVPLNLANYHIDKLPESEKKHKIRGLAHHLQAIIFLKRKQFNNAIPYYDKAIKESKLSPSQDRLRMLVDLYNDKGYTYFLMRKYDSAKKIYSKIFQLKNFQTQEISLSVVYGNLGILSYQSGDFNKAFFYFNKSIPVLEKNNLTEELIENYHVLSSLYERTEQKEKASEYLLKEFKLYKTLNDKQKNGLQSILNQIDDESEKNTQKEKTTKLVIFISVLILILYYYFYKKKKEKKNAEIVKTKKQDHNILQKPVNNEKRSQISSETLENILQRLNDFEKTNKFTKKNITLSSLATQLKTNNQSLSEIINKHKGKNFNSYINELRILYIAEKIKNDDEYRKYKISYLAEESGFLSHSTFTKTFKQIIGVSPSEYIENHT
ncbi:helix-turn-helix domain-containing protein [Chryseobacterium sp. MIQD13]|uniref:helix-turn-helix domain-containing protein n=1 Tax=Chryseobacterium sp. MIQD13 TaxID=3422310 RepID=UPI003D2E7838